MNTPLNNQPLSGNAMPRFGGIATMMRLPLAESRVVCDAPSSSQSLSQG